MSQLLAENLPGITGNVSGFRALRRQRIDPRYQMQYDGSVTQFPPIDLGDFDFDSLDWEYLQRFEDQLRQGDFGFVTCSTDDLGVLHNKR